MNPTEFNQMLNERLTQSTYWTDRNDAKHRIAFMPQGYALNVILWLEDRAEQLRMQAVLDAYVAGRDVDARRITEHTAKEWLHASPLVRKLREKLDSEHLAAMVRGEPECSRCHDFIAHSVHKYNGQPFHFHCYMQTKHDEKLAEKQQADEAFNLHVMRGLGDCHAELSANVAGMMDRIDDPQRLLRIAQDVQDMKTSDILVLGVYLASQAEAALGRFATSRS